MDNPLFTNDSNRHSRIRTLSAFSISIVSAFLFIVSLLFCYSWPENEKADNESPNVMQQTSGLEKLKCWVTKSAVKRRQKLCWAYCHIYVYVGELRHQIREDQVRKVAFWFAAFVFTRFFLRFFFSFSLFFLHRFFRSDKTFSWTSLVRTSCRILRDICVAHCCSNGLVAPHHRKCTLSTLLVLHLESGWKAENSGKLEDGKTPREVWGKNEKKKVTKTQAFFPFGQLHGRFIRRFAADFAGNSEQVETRGKTKNAYSWFAKYFCSFELCSENRESRGKKKYFSENEE